jgi:AcrR family transcriptional regulator
LFGGVRVRINCVDGLRVPASSRYRSAKKSPPEPQCRPFVERCARVVVGCRAVARNPDSDRRVPLTRQRIAEAALRVIDRDGLGALTMKRLGSELGVEAMSVYFHFSNKDEILDEVVDLLFRELPLPEEAGAERWAEVALELFSNLRRHLLDHLGAVSLIASRRAHSVDALAPTEMSLRNLRRAGFDEWEAIDGHRLLLSFTVGYLICEARAHDASTTHPEDWGTAAYALHPLPAEQAPTLAELAPIALAGHTDSQFDRCLRDILTALHLRRESRLAADGRGEGADTRSSIVEADCLTED